jgi:probable rRNA maturation factor
MTPGGPRRPARSVRVAVSDERGRPVSPALAIWLADVAPARARGTVHLAVVSDAQVRALNRRYRGLDQATDVLSFPASQRPPARPRGRSRARSETCIDPLGPGFLGDIVIARGVARRQALAAGHDEATELRVLALHGLLHLLGYDHERDTGTMARLEGRLRRRGGLREGLIERQ